MDRTKGICKDEIVNIHFFASSLHHSAFKDHSAFSKDPMYNGGLHDKQHRVWPQEPLIRFITCIRFIIKIGGRSGVALLQSCSTKDLFKMLMCMFPELKPYQILKQEYPLTKSILWNYTIAILKEKNRNLLNEVFFPMYHTDFPVIADSPSSIASCHFVTSKQRINVSEFCQISTH